MALTLSLAGLDLTPFVRVHPEDGLDPMDPDLLEYTMTQSSGIEGPSLLSAQAGAREMVFPLHVTPTKTVDFPDTKDGLHAQLSNLNLQCKFVTDDSPDQTLVWQDDGASNPSSFQILAARWESDYNFRRGQRLWASGVLRVWTKPYAHSGTYRSMNMGSNVNLMFPGSAGVGYNGMVIGTTTLNASIVVGDLDADHLTFVKVGSYRQNENMRLTAISLSLGVSDWFRVQQAIWSDIQGRTAFGGPFQESGLEYFLDAQRGFNPDSSPFDLPPYLRIPLRTSTVFPKGRYRVMGLLKGAGLYSEMIDASGNSLGQRVAASSFRSEQGVGFNVGDFGVVELEEPGKGSGTYNFYLRHAGGDRGPNVAPKPCNRLIATDLVQSLPAPCYMARGMIGEIFMFHEDRSCMIVDTDRRLLGHDGFTRMNYQAGAGSFLAGGAASPDLDMMGNPYVRSQPGISAGFSPSYGLFSGGLGSVVNHIYGIGSIGYSNIQAEIWFQTTTTPAAGVAFYVGKTDIVDNTNTTLLKYEHANASRGAFAIVNLAGTLAASVGVAAATVAHMIWRNAGPRVEGQLWNTSGTCIGTITGSMPNAGIRRPVAIGLAGSGPAGVNHSLQGYRAQTYASVGREPGDIIVFDSRNQRAWEMNAASIYKRDLTPYLRGRIPRIPAQTGSAYMVMYAWNPPVGDEGCRTTPGTSEYDWLTVMDVRVNERWRYSR